MMKMLPHYSGDLCERQRNEQRSITGKQTSRSFGGEPSLALWKERDQGYIIVFVLSFKTIENDQEVFQKGKEKKCVSANKKHKHTNKHTHTQIINTHP